MSLRISTITVGILLPLGVSWSQNIALPPTGGFSPIVEPSIAAGELLARDSGFLSLEAVSPTCVESTVAAMAADDAAAKALGNRLRPWGTNGSPTAIMDEWGDDVRKSCHLANADRLIAATREWTEQPAAPWKAVWEAVLEPVGHAPYWNRLRSGSRPAFCDDSNDISPESSSSRASRREGSQQPCITERTYFGGASERERNRIALQIVADIGLDDEQAAALNAFSLDVILRGGGIDRQIVQELFCDRLSLLETPAVMGRVLNEAQALRIEQEAALFLGISEIFDAETIEKLYRYAAQIQPTTREVDHKAWFSKLPTEVVDRLVEVRCMLARPIPSPPRGNNGSRQRRRERG